MTLKTVLRSLHASPYRSSMTRLNVSEITPRVLVISEPVNGTFPYVSYKNSLTDLLKYIDTELKTQNWVLVNLQQEPSKYSDHDVLHNVKHFPVPDHAPPSFATLVRAVDFVCEFLAQDDSNVILVHCKAGKGRSGTLVCAYLMQAAASTAVEANETYTSRRMRLFFQGVSISSQKRYLRYFEQYLAGGRQYCGAGGFEITSIELQNCFFVPGLVQTIEVVVSAHSPDETRVCEIARFTIDAQCYETLRVVEQPFAVSSADCKIKILANGVSLGCFWFNFVWQNSPYRISSSMMDGVKGTAIKPPEMFGSVEVAYRSGQR